MTKLVNMQQLGPAPSGYGIEPPEGRKYIPALVDFAIDQDWKYDFTSLQMQKQFSYVQQVIIDNQLNITAGFDLFFNGVKVYSAPAASSAFGFPIMIPVFGKNPTIINITGRGTAAGTLVATFLNYALWGGGGMAPAPR